MPKVKFDISKITRELRNAVDDASRDNAFFKQAGDLVTTRIKGFARKGKPLNSKGRFPSLLQSTIEQRRKIKAAGFKTHPAFSPPKSNVTITGQLVDAITFRRKRARKFEIFVAPSKRTFSGDPDNQTLARYLADLGFILFDKEGIEEDGQIPRRLKQLLLRFLRKQLRR